MIFHLKADATFEAENIDDAFKVLRGHFQSLVDGNSGVTFVGVVEIERRELHRPTPPAGRNIKEPW